MRGGGSSDPEGPIASYRWESGDGQVASGSTVRFTYPRVGGYLATLTVTDSEGQTASVSETITVSSSNNQPPVARLTLTPASGVVPLEVALDGSGSSDPDGAVVEYRWNSEDGQQEVSERASATLRFTSAGVRVVTLTVVDDKGATASATATVEAWEPLLANPQSITLAPGERGTLAVSGGTPPYQWTTSAGQLLASEGSSVGYVAPQVVCESDAACQTVTIRDRNSQQVEVAIQVRDELRLTPLDRTVLLGEAATLTFTASGGVSPYRWEAEDGRLSATIGETVDYAPAVVAGSSLVTVRDAGSGSVSARVVVLSLPRVTPATLRLDPGEGATLRVSGGGDPIRWQEEAGDLTSSEGRSVFYSAPVFRVAIPSPPATAPATPVRSLSP